MFLVHPQCLGLLGGPCIESSCVETEQGHVWAELGLQEDPCAPEGREAVLPWPLECPCALLLPLVLPGDGLRHKGKDPGSSKIPQQQSKKRAQLPDSQELTFPTEWPKSSAGIPGVEYLPPGFQECHCVTLRLALQGVPCVCV